jgi:glycosyltransferase involved in cell wall biosynthesis
MAKQKQSVKQDTRKHRSAPRRTCVLVLGMHRSGTSALARTIAFFGAKLPQVMLGGNPTNEAGHWEPERLIAYHDQLLRQLSSSWHDWRPLEMTRLSPARRDQIKIDIRNLIDTDYPGASLFVVKEPRICRFADFFVDALEEAAVDVVPVVVLRNPLEVIASLQHRSAIWPATYSEADAALLWLSHVLEAERASRDRPRAIVTYQDLMTDWRGTMAKLVAQTGVRFPVTAEEAAPLVEPFLRQDLRHHEKGAGDVALDPLLGGWVSEAFEALVRLSVNPSAQNPRQVLDRIYLEFRRALPILGNMLSAAHQRVETAIEHVRQETTQQASDYTRQIAELGAKLAERESELSQSHDEIGRLTAEVQQTSRESDGLRHDRERTSAALSEEQNIVQRAKSLLGAIPGDNRPLDQLIADWSAEAVQQRNSLQLANSAAEEARRTQFDLQARLEEAARRTAEIERAREESERHRKAAVSDLAELKRHASARDGELGEQIETLTAAKRELEERLGRFDGQTRTLAETQAQLAEQQRHFDVLSAEKAAHQARADALDAERLRTQAEEKRIQEVLDAVYASTSWRLTAPVRAVKRTVGQLGTATRSALRLLREGRLDARMIRRGINRLPALMKQGKLTNPTDFASMVETLAPDDVARVVSAFDKHYYLANNPDVARAGIDPLSHFMLHGWKEHRDPSPEFSVSHYLTRYPDIARAGINPFIHYVLHGQRERRSSLPYRMRLQRMEFQPKITAVLPNYNHARFLDQRIRSILEQTYTNLDVVILDDCSSDDSRAVIERWRAQHPSRVRTIFNDRNSGNVFRQWRKGVEAADGDLVWICESDDFCEPDFVEKLIPHFRDRSVQIAFGRIQFADRDGRFQAGLDQYREGAESGIWDAPVVRPAKEWFTNAFGVNNVIANVGGCIWRRQVLSERVWKEAEQFTVLGDWFLYCHLAGGGQIAYEPSAVAYFRQHGQNTSVTSFSKAPYYEEHQRLMTLLRRTWDVPHRTVERFISKVEFQYRHFKVEKTLGPLSGFLDRDRLLSVSRDRPHILMAFLGFHSGGGEVFPINLANALHDQGHLVSMIALDMSHVIPEMLAALKPGIPVYDAAWVAEVGADRFLAAAGVSVIHSHMISLEFFFFKECRIGTTIPYLVSLHGSYDSGTLDPAVLAQIAERVSHWVYTADKNLEPFRALALAPERFSKLGNGMPVDLEPFPRTREDLGIDKDAVVFTLVARGILRKGWRASITAFIRLRERHPEAKLHLLLCGEGEQTERHQKAYERDQDITFLGYQSRIPGLYRLSDVAIVPTRFEGESFPLCVIQALQTSTPVISTRVGEFEWMIEQPGCAPAGLLLDPGGDSENFI